MNKQLEQAYRATDYCLWLAGEEFILRVDSPAPAALAVLATRLNLANTAYIVTPCNPESRQLPDEANRKRLAEFRRQLHADKMRWLPSVNRDPTSEWPEEPGAIILDCGIEYASALARKYEQNAILEVALNAAPRLILL